MVINGSAFSPTLALKSLTALVLVVSLAACQDSDNQRRDPALGDSGVRRISKVDVGSSSAGNYLAGRFALDRHDLGVASDYLLKAIESDPENNELLQRALLSLAADGRMDEASDVARRILQYDSESPLAAILLAGQDAKHERWQAVEERINKLPKRGINSFMGPLIVAWARVGRNDIDGALEALAPLSKNSAFAALHDFHVALIADLAGRNDMADEYYRATLSGGAGLSLRTLEAASAFYRRMGHQEMVAELDSKQNYRLSQKYGLLADARQDRLIRNAKEGLAEAFFAASGSWRQGRLPELALVFGRMAIDLQPDFALAQMSVGEILQDWGRLEEADKVFSRISPDSGAVYWAAQLQLAANQNELGDTEGALSTLRELSKKQPDNSDALVTMGDILRQHERWAEAGEAYAKAISITSADSPDLWALYYSYGVCLERSKRWADAEGAFLKSLELRPNEPHVLNYLGYSWVDRGVNIERARTMIEKAVEQKPQDGYIVDSLGWAYYRTGDYKKAVETLERAVELRPEDPTINDHFGDALWMVGRKAEAEFQWKRVLTFKPDDEQKASIEKKLSGQHKPDADQPSQSR